MAGVAAAFDQFEPGHGEAAVDEAEDLVGEPNARRDADGKKAPPDPGRGAGADRRRACEMRPAHEVLPTKAYATLTAGPAWAARRDRIPRSPGIKAYRAKKKERPGTHGWARTGHDRRQR
jgi:hypothetical protein